MQLEGWSACRSNCADTICTVISKSRRGRDPAWRSVLSVCAMIKYSDGNNKVVALRSASRDDPHAFTGDSVGRQDAQSIAGCELVFHGILGRHIAPITVLMSLQMLASRNAVCGRNDVSTAGVATTCPSGKVGWVKMSWWGFESVAAP